MNIFLVLSLAAVALATPQRPGQTITYTTTTTGGVQRQPIRIEYQPAQRPANPTTITVINNRPGGGGWTTGFTGADNGGIENDGNQDNKNENEGNNNGNEGNNNADNHNGGGGSTGQCIGLHGRCNAVAAINLLAKAQCCEGLHCQLSVFEGIFWPTFACTNLKEKIGMGGGKVYDKPVGK